MLNFNAFTSPTTTKKTGLNLSAFGGGAVKKEPVDVRTVSLPEHLGGGEYKTSGAGTLIKTDRGYAGLSTKEQEERDHIISVSLGGTSNKANLQYLKTNEAGRQEGKVSVEQLAINDYLNGKIDLPEARAKIAHKQQKIKGLIPEQGVKAYIGEGVKKTLLDVGSFFKGLFKKEEPLRAKLTEEGEKYVSKLKGKEKTDYGEDALQGELTEEGQKYVSTLTPEKRKETLMSKLNKLTTPTEEDFSPEELAKLNSGQQAISRYGELSFINDKGEIQSTDIIGGVGSLERKVTSKIIGKTKNIADNIIERFKADDVKIMEDFIDNVRLKKPIDVDLEKQARYLMEGVGLSPEQTNTKIANVFDDALQKYGQVERPITPKLSDDIAKAKAEGKSFETGENFYQRMSKESRDTLRDNNIKGEEQVTKWFNKNVTPKELILDTLNPTGSLFVDYNPQKRASMKLGDNITTLDKTMGKSADEVITIYRGAPRSQKEIVRGDFITTNRNLAKSYIGEDGVVLLKKVKAKDVLDDLDSPLGEEYLYGGKSQLKKLWEGETLLNQEGFTKMPKFMESAAESIAPIKHQDEVVQKVFKKWNRELLIGEQKANNLITKIPKLNDNFDTILKYQAGTETKYTKLIKSEFDKLYKEGQKAGLDIKYRKNYVPQVYQNTTEEVQTAMSKYMKSKGVADDVIDKYIRGIEETPKAISNRLKINPTFVKDRAFPDYKTAMEFGLTPKYKEPSQLLSHYKLELEKTIANKKFLDSLIDSKRVRSVRQADSNWQAVNLPFSPKGYYAEPSLAKMLNGIFRNEEMLGVTQKAIKGFANLAKSMQELVLSAGIPKTDVNFFAIGMGLVKEVTAGNLKAVSNFIKANFNKATIKHFAKNRETLEMMARQGIDMSKTIGNHKDIYKKIGDIKGLDKKIGFIWDKSFQEKTFNNLLPMNYLDTFKSAYKRALKKMPKEQAEKLAGDTVRAFHGIYESVGRGKGTEDVLSATLFAPTFREGIINTLFNTAKSVTTEIFNPAYRKNKQLIAGMILSYAGYNALNKKLSGHYMKDNPVGKEFELMIPTGLGENGDDVIYVPFMPSFLAFPRSLVSGGIATVKGDVKTAVQKFSGLASMPLSLLGELWANKDYFGREIYDEDATGTEQMKQMAGYVFGINKKGASGGINHPFIRETYNQILTDKPLYQSVSEAMEMPLKFSSMSKIQQQRLYKREDKKRQEVKRVKEEFRPTYDEIQEKRDAGQIEEAKQQLDALTDDEYKIYKSLARADKTAKNREVETRIFDEYEAIMELIDTNREDAQRILDSFTNEEYEAYKRLKNRLK